MGGLNIITPTWPAPPHIVALTTTRSGGVSVGRHASLNLAAHVDDNIEHVLQNRQILQQALQLPSKPFWLEQVHGVNITQVDLNTVTPTADGSYTDKPASICAVLTADCLPVLLCNRKGTEVAAVHVGWRGCLAGILTNAVRAFHTPPSELLAWLGPAIGPKAFEVKQDVFDAFTAQDSNNENAFSQLSPTQYHANLYQLASNSLITQGVTAIYGGDYCTFTDHLNFFSYRKTGGVTGRMASLIFIKEV